MTIPPGGGGPGYGRRPVIIPGRHPLRARGRRIVATVAAAALLLAACSGTPADPTGAADGTPRPDGTGAATTPTATPTVTPETAHPPTPTGRRDAAPADVPDVLDFTAPALSGGQVRGAEFTGEDVVFWMWAPW